VTFEITVRSYEPHAPGWSWAVCWTDENGKRNEASGGEATEALAHEAAESLARAVARGTVTASSYTFNASTGERT
jgi:hypothetical protein